MIDEKKIELMKKLQRLAERGVGGEKEGAQKKLQQLMKKYNIEESDLSDDKLEDHEWKYHNDEEMIIRPQDDAEMSDEDAMRMQMAMSAMKDKSMTQRIEG